MTDRDRDLIADLRAAGRNGRAGYETMVGRQLAQGLGDQAANRLEELLQQVADFKIGLDRARDAAGEARARIKAMTPGGEP